jgi:hypothetical protein
MKEDARVTCYEEEEEQQEQEQEQPTEGSQLQGVFLKI